MKKKLNLIGKTFGNLLVIAKATTRKTHSYWLCKNIITGEEKELRGSHLVGGKTKGIINVKKNQEGTYYKKNKIKCQFKSAWQDMNRRCYDQNNDSFKYYGGHPTNPTSVCWEWCRDNPLGFNNFKQDMYEDYIEAKSLYETVHLDKDIKIPGNKVYCKKACMWVKPLDNLRAKSNFKGEITPDLVRYIRKERHSNNRNYNNIAKELNVSKGCVYAIANYISWKHIS